MVAGESLFFLVVAGQPELSHNGVLAEWWLESHWVVGGGWTARVVTSLLSGGWKASGFFFGWMVAGKP